MHRRHDPTYYWATRRLPEEIRPATHALYGYVRTADQIVDGPRRDGRPEARRAALDAWEAELEAGLAAGHSQPAGGRRARRRRPPPPPAARRAAALHALDAARLRAGADRRPGTSSSATWRARPARSGGSWRRCSASPRRTTRASAGSGSRSSTRTSSATCARTAGSTASTCRARSASASASRRPTSTARRPRPSCARWWPTRCGGRAGCSRAPRAPSRPRPPRCGPGIRLACTIYLGVLDRVEALGYDVLGRRPRLPAWQLPLVALAALRR